VTRPTRSLVQPCRSITNASSVASRRDRQSPPTAQRVRHDLQIASIFAIVQGLERFARGPNWVAFLDNMFGRGPRAAWRRALGAWRSV
jgi:hypothetical protein